MSTYTVTLSNNFEADSPEEALAQMVAWASENAYAAGYRVTKQAPSEYDSIFMDAERVLS